MRRLLPIALTALGLCHLALAQATSEGTVSLEKQVTYSTGGRLAMDMARPKGAGTYPAVIAIHGGGFSSGERASYDPLLLRLAGRGYVAVSIDYRLAPGSQFPSALQDAKTSVRFLR